MDGLLLVDKPAGPTSHDIVARVRRVLGERRIGHTGTLDPMASGLLPLVLGRATRLARFLSASDKTYEAEIRLGFATSTYDALGTASAPPYGGPMPSREDIEGALQSFRGTFLQQPPAYSAKKIDGQRSYKLARARSALTPAVPAPSTLSALPAPPGLPAPVSVTAHAIDLVTCNGDRVTLRVDCSAGFYVRSLAHDLGQRLGTAAHLSSLRRIRSGDFSLAGAASLETLERDPAAAIRAIVPLSGMLTGLAAAMLTEAGEAHVAHGRNLGPGDVLEFRAGAGAGPHVDHVRLIDRTGRLLGLAEPAGDAGALHPSVVLV
jgi:tRNA pseudouridine55 synthase